MQALQQLAPDLRVLTLQHLPLHERLALPPSLAGSWLAHAHPTTLDLAGHQLSLQLTRTLLQLLRHTPALRALRLNLYAACECDSSTMSQAVAQHTGMHAPLKLLFANPHGSPACTPCANRMAEAKDDGEDNTQVAPILLDLIQACAALPDLHTLDLRQLFATPRTAALAPTLAFALQHVRHLGLQELVGTPCIAGIILREAAAMQSLEQLDLRGALRWRSDGTVEPWMLQPLARAPALQRIVVSEGVCPAGPPTGLAGKVVVSVD